MARILTAGAEFGDIAADGFTTWAGAVLNRVSTFVPQSPGGFLGNYSFYATAGTGSEYDFEPTYPSGLNEVYIRLHFHAGNRTDGTWELLRLTTPDGSIMLRWGLTDGGSGVNSGGNWNNYLYNSAGTVFASSSVDYKNNEWNLVEMHIKFGGSGAIAQLRVNETLIIDWTGSLVGPSAEDTFTKFRIYNNVISGGVSNTRYYDNIAINDTTGTINSGWVGDGYIVGLYPSGNGTTSQLVNADNTSVDNFKFINRRRTTNTMNFVAASAPNDKDTYALPSPPEEFNGVNAIAVAASAVRHGNAITQARMLLQPPAQLEVQSANIALPVGGEDYIRAEFNNNPNTGEPYTLAELDAMEAGIQFLA